MYKNVKHQYFSIDDIMAAQEKLPCQFTKKIEFIGKLFPFIKI